MRRNLTPKDRQELLLLAIDLIAGASDAERPALVATFLKAVAAMPASEVQTFRRRMIQAGERLSARKRSRAHWDRRQRRTGGRGAACWGEIQRPLNGGNSSYWEL